MAISEFSDGPLRKQIGFSRVLPSEALEVFKKRGYECYILDDEALSKPGVIETTDSVVLTQTREDPHWPRKELKRFGSLLDHDCRIYVRHAGDSHSKEVILCALNELQLPPSGFTKSDATFFSDEWFDGPDAAIFAPFVHIVAANDNWDPLANLIASNPAGRPMNVNLTIDMRDADRRKIQPSTDEELLLRRAFWNCASIQMIEKGNGLSRVRAFETYVHLASNVVGGDWPVPLFRQAWCPIEGCEGI